MAPDQLQTLGPAVLNAIAMMLNSVGRGIKIVVVQDIQVNDKNWEDTYRKLDNLYQDGGCLEKIKEGYERCTMEGDSWILGLTKMALGAKFWTPNRRQTWGQVSKSLSKISSISKTISAK